jgi:nucleotide-binding universal stress UspA family protein
MLKLSKLILPVDFSAKNAVVASHARVLSKQFGGEVILMHVMRPFQLAVEGVDVPSAVVVDWYNDQKPLLEKQLADFESLYLKGCRVRRMLIEGEPASEILRVAEQEDADVILLPTHGYGAFRRFILGSVKVLHDSSIPVLTGAHIEVPEGDKETVEQINVAVDMGAQTGKLIGIAAGLAQDLSAKLTVVHATPDEGEGVARYLDPGWRMDIAKQIHTEIEALLEQAGVKAAIELIAGDPARVVRHVATQTRADLVVVGRHVEKGLLGRIRTHSYSIVREAPCPVLSV